MAEPLFRAHPVSVKARQSLIERAVKWLATESGWARSKRSAICGGKLCRGFIIFGHCSPCGRDSDSVTSTTELSFDQRLLQNAGLWLRGILRALLIKRQNSRCVRVWAMTGACIWSDTRRRGICLRWSDFWNIIWYFAIKSSKCSPSEIFSRSLTIRSLWASTAALSPRSLSSCLPAHCAFLSTG